MTKTVGLDTMRFPDLASDAAPWALVEVRLVADTKGHPHHPWSRAAGLIPVTVPTDEAGLSRQECQAGRQPGRGS